MDDAPLIEPRDRMVDGMWRVAGRLSPRIRGRLVRLAVPHLMRARALDVTVAAVVEALADAVATRFDARVNIDHMRQARMLDGDVAGNYHAWSRTIELRQAGVRTVAAYLGGDCILTGDPAADTRRRGLLVQARTQLAVAVHEAIHSLEDGRSDITVHSRSVMEADYGRVLSEGLTEAATARWFDETLADSGLARIEPAILDMPYVPIYPAEVVAVTGMVGALGRRLGLSADATLTQLVRGGRSPLALARLVQDMVGSVPAAIAADVTSGYMAAITRPLADMERALPFIYPAPNARRELGEVAAAAIGERLDAADRALRGILAAGASGRSAAPHRATLAQLEAPTRESLDWVPPHIVDQGAVAMTRIDAMIRDAGARGRRGFGTGHPDIRTDAGLQ